MVASVNGLTCSTKLFESHSLGWFAYQAIQKHFKKVIHYKKAVLNDADPEPLHQMRVGMRRLRTTLYTYGSVVNLPPEAGDASIKKLAKILGAVRDFDVLIQKLEQTYRPTLPHDEQRTLDAILSKQRKYRRKQFAKLEKTLTGNPYKRFKSAYKHWLDAPHYYALAECPIELVLPDLLLPLVSQLFRHRGWFVGSDLPQGEMELSSLNRWLEEEGLLLHDLRKQMKQVRYQAEFLAEFYGDALNEPVAQFKAVQELLGQLQDCWILNQVLEHQVGADWAQQLPTLAQRLKEERGTIWHEWRPIQNQFLNPDYRNHLRHIIAVPSPSSPPSLSHPSLSPNQVKSAC